MTQNIFIFAHIKILDYFMILKLQNINILIN